MTTHRTCDHCHATIHEGDWYHTIPHPAPTMGELTDYDVCFACTYEIINWIHTRTRTPIPTP